MRVDKTTIELRHGGQIDIHETWSRVTLPDGSQVHAVPRSDQVEIARDLGYGDDVNALTRDHDPLHALLADLLGLNASRSLQGAAGVMAYDGTPEFEECAVMALQRYVRALGLDVPEIARRNGYEVA
jgi:hypothetical protein